MDPRARLDKGPRSREIDREQAKGAGTERGG